MTGKTLGKPPTGRSAAGIKPTAFRMVSQFSTTEPLPFSQLHCVIKSKSVPVNIGVPQGSIMGPLFTSDIFRYSYRETTRLLLVALNLKIISKFTKFTAAKGGYC